MGCQASIRKTPKNSFLQQVNCGLQKVVKLCVALGAKKICGRNVSTYLTFTDFLQQQRATPISLLFRRKSFYALKIPTSILYAAHIHFADFRIAPVNV